MVRRVVRRVRRCQCAPVAYCDVSPGYREGWLVPSDLLVDLMCSKNTPLTNNVISRVARLTVRVPHSAGDSLRLRTPALFSVLSLHQRLLPLTWGRCMALSRWRHTTV